MGVTYTTGSDLSTLDPKVLGERLESITAGALVWLRKVSDDRAGRPESSGKWSGKQVIGHLTDSAVNNLARIVKMQIVSGARMEGYEQEAWVTVQHYAERDWEKVLEAWSVLNQQIAWTVAHTTQSKLASVGVVEDVEMTLGFLIEDYLAHMEHHLTAMRQWMADRSG